MSERDGWHHIYIHKKDGSLVKQITKGKWEVKKIVDVDEKIKKYILLRIKKLSLRIDFTVSILTAEI